MFGPVRSFFKHHRAERRGAMILGGIILAVIIGTEIFRLTYSPDPVDFTVYILKDSTNESSMTEGANRPSKFSPFQFNPNTLTDSGYAALGFSEKEIQTLRNYQRSGATFRIKSDFSRLFFVDSIEYQLLEPFINLPDVLPGTEKSDYSTKKFAESEKIIWSDTANYDSFRFVEFTCDINKADTSELKRLKGIGSFYARKIVEYRQELGGFHSLAQLLELYKMTPEKIDGFADNVVIDLNDLRKIAVNSASAQELAKHPYLTFHLANQLVIYRESIGKFSSAQHLCGSGLLDGDLCRKLAPYLSFE